LAEGDGDPEEVLLAEFTLPATRVVRFAAGGPWHAGYGSLALDFGLAGLMPVTPDESAVGVVPERLSTWVREGGGDIAAVAVWVARCGAVAPLPEEADCAILAPDALTAGIAKRHGRAFIGIQAALDARQLCHECFPGARVQETGAAPVSSSGSPTLPTPSRPRRATA
jgi:hypothetical protein